MTTLICAINKVRIGVFNTKIVCENGGGERKKHTRAEIYIYIERACVRACVDVRDDVCPVAVLLASFLLFGGCGSPLLTLFRTFSLSLALFLPLSDILFPLLTFLTL